MEKFGSGSRRARLVPTPLETVLLTELCAVARACYERGWLPGGSGNFSLRMHGDLVWQSPTGGGKGQLQATQFLPIDPQSGEHAGPLPCRPSEEMPVHLGIYRALPPSEARCVVHAHGPHLVAATTGVSKLVIKGQEMIKALGCQHFDETLALDIAPNLRKDDLAQWHEGMLPYLNRGAQMVILAGHGAYAWGLTPQAALARLEALEYLCAVMKLND